MSRANAIAYYHKNNASLMIKDNGEISTCGTINLRELDPEDRVELLTEVAKACGIDGEYFKFTIEHIVEQMYEEEQDDKIQ